MKKILPSTMFLFLLLSSVPGAAAQTKSKEMAELVNKELLIAAEHGDTLTVKQALNDGAQIEALNKFGLTALCLASSNGHLDTVRLLLD